MDPLVSVAQLEARMQRTLDVGQATQAITDASGLVRAIARQDFTFVSGDTITIEGGDRRLKLPQRPLVVDADNPLIVIELGDLGGVDFTLIEHRDYERSGDELIRGYPWYWNNTRLLGWPFNRTLGIWAPRVRVTYSHGYQVIPDDVVAIVLDVAQVFMSNPKGLRSKTVGGYSETYAMETLGRDMVDNIASKLRVTGRRRGAFSVRQL